MKKPERKENRTIEDKAETERALLAIKTADPHVRKMIQLALQGLEAGVPRMTPEEIFVYLGRR